MHGLFNKRHRVQGIALWTNEELARMWCGSTSKTSANSWSCVRLLFSVRLSWSSVWVLPFQCHRTRLLETSRPQSPPRPVSESPGTQPPETWRATKWPFTPLGMILTWGNCWLALMIAPLFLRNSGKLPWLWDISVLWNLQQSSLINTGTGKPLSHIVYLGFSFMLQQHLKHKRLQNVSTITKMSWFLCGLAHSTVASRQPFILQTKRFKSSHLYYRQFSLVRLYQYNSYSKQKFSHDINMKRWPWLKVVYHLGERLK